MTGSRRPWDDTYDFIAVGSGIGGFASAIAAADAGMSALIVEKAAELGGVTAFSAGQLWIPDNHVERLLGIADSLDEGREYLEFLSSGWAERDLQRVFLERSPEALEYFGKAGVPWRVCRRQPDYHFPDAPGSVAEGRYIEVEPFDASLLGSWQAKLRTSPYMPSGITTEEMYDWGGPTNRPNWDHELLERRIAEDHRTFGPGVMAAFARIALVDREIPAWTSSPVRRLVVDEGEVVGVELEREGELIAVRARRGVLIAAGGYDHAPKGVARMWEQRPDWESRSPSGVEGDNLVMGAEIGAAVAVLPPMKAALLGYRIPGATVEGRPKWNVSGEGGFPHAMIVNRAGRRFADESFYRDYQPATQIFDGLSNTYVNLPCYLIFDQTFRDAYAIAEVQPGDAMPEEFAVSADTVPGLAERLGVNPDGLAETVARFNGFAATGIDEDFGRGSRPWAMRVLGDSGHRPNPSVAPLATPPFYGLELRTVSSGINVAGLRFDREARVTHVRGHAIPGLYAAGNSSAHIDIGAGYNSGIANTRGMTWGYVAAMHAAGRS